LPSIGSLAGSPICPFYPSPYLPPPTQAGRAATDVSLFDPPAPAASAQVWSVTTACLRPVLIRLSPTTPPPAWRQLMGACQEPEHGRTGGWRRVGDPVWYAVALAGRWAFDCTQRSSGCCCSTTDSSML